MGGQGTGIMMAGFVIYLAVVLFVGIYAGKMNKNNVDYYVGGRGMGQWVLATSMCASDMSGFIFTGIAGMFWSTGMPVLGDYVFVFVVYIAIFFTQGFKLRVASRVLDAVTIPDYFEARFKDKSHVLRWCTCVIMVIGVTVYVMSQFTAGGKVLATLFGWQQWVGIIITALFVVGYTTGGGFFAVCWTDFLQGMIMCVASLVLAFLAVKLAGGFGAGWDSLVNMVNAGELESRFIEPFQDIPYLISWAFIVLGTFGYPHVNVRFMAAKDTKTSIEMLPLVMIIMAVFETGTAIAGILGKAIYPSVEMIRNSDPEMLYITMFMDHLPGFFCGVLVAGIIAAVMSTADSLLLVGSSAIANDIGFKILHPEWTEEKVLKVGRWATIGLGLLAYLLTFTHFKSVYWISSNAWTWLGSLGPGMILSLFWKRTTKIGVLVGFWGAIIIGTGWVITGLQDIYQPTGVAIISGLLITWIVSLITPQEPKEIQDLVDLFDLSSKKKPVTGNAASTASVINHHIEENMEVVERYAAPALK